VESTSNPRQHGSSQLFGKRNINHSPADLPPLFLRRYAEVAKKSGPPRTGPNTKVDIDESKIGVENEPFSKEFPLLPGMSVETTIHPVS
jgi:hypothetical protein